MYHSQRTNEPINQPYCSYRTLFARLTSAPAATSCLTQSMWFFLQAANRGVCPAWVNRQYSTVQYSIVYSTVPYRRLSQSICSNVKELYVCTPLTLNRTSKLSIILNCWAIATTNSSTPHTATVCTVASREKERVYND